MDRVNITIIGGGAVGGALAYELSKTLDDIVVVDPHKSVRKMDDTQSVRNSGVIHAGIYYDPADRPLKARLCPQGNALLYKFCKDHDVPHRRTGKLLVATEDWQLEYLRDVQRVAHANGVPGVAWLQSQHEIQEFEPNVQGIAALHVPTSGIIDPVIYLEKLHQLAEGTKNVLHVWGSRVTGITPSEGGFRITTDTLGQGEDTFETRYLINAAGLHADIVARMLSPEFPHVIRGTPGESAKFYQKRPEIMTAGMNVYPAPYAHDLDGKVLEIPLQEARARVKAGTAFYTLGVHLTPTLGDENGEYAKDAQGRFVLGKTVTLGPAKNKYADTRDFEVLKKEYDRLKREPAYYHERVHAFFPGLRQDKEVQNEDLWKGDMFEEVLELYEDMRQEVIVQDIELHQFGVMATIKGYPDWFIAPDRNHPHCTHLVGIDSPGLTGSLAIAEYVQNTFFRAER